MSVNLFVMNKILLIIIFALGLLANGLLYFFAVQNNVEWLYSENALMENVQAIVALIAAMVGLITCIRYQGLTSAAAFACAVLGWSIFLREVDVERLHYNIPQALVWLGHGIGRNSMLLILWIGVFWQIKKQFASIKQNFRSLVFSPSGKLLLISFGLLILSDLFEKHILGGLHHVFYEELMELDAFLLFLLAALLIKISVAKATNQSDRHSTQ